MNHKAFRIVEIKAGEPHTLFHGLNGSRRLPVGKWLKAERHKVRDGTGGRWYQSGFHVLPTRAIAERFLAARFRAPRDLRIIEVMVEGLRPKPTNRDVLLADRMLISEGSKL